MAVRGSRLVALGRLNQVQRARESAIKYEYDFNDRITNLAVGDFYNLSYTYDFMGRLSTINTPVGSINYEYQLGEGQVIRKLPNGVKTIWEFSANGQQLKRLAVGLTTLIDAGYHTKRILQSNGVIRTEVYGPNGEQVHPSVQGSQSELIYNIMVGQ